MDTFYLPGQKPAARSSSYYYLHDVEGSFFGEFRKKRIKEILSTLRKEEYIVYKWLCRLEKSEFAICRTFSFRIFWQDRKRNDPCNLDTVEEYSVEEFFALVGSFHRNDEFRIRFRDDLFGTADDSDGYSFRQLFELYIRVRCEQGLRENRPFGFSQRQARVEGLNREDIRQLNELVGRCTDQAASRLQAEYDALKKLDCIVP